MHDKWLNNFLLRENYDADFIALVYYDMSIHSEASDLLDNHSCCTCL